MMMKSFYLRGFLVLGLCFLLGGCSKPEERLIGMWQDDELNVLEFHPDGSWYSQQPGSTFKKWGTWVIDEETGILSLRYANPPMPTYEHPYDFSVSSDSLEISEIGAGGEEESVFVYHRIGEITPSVQE